MAKAIGQRPRRQPAADTSREILEVVGRLEALAVVNEETRSSVFAALEVGDVPDYASAYQELFAAVAMLSPAQAARVIDAGLGPNN
jgi:dihydropteroate synthase